MAAAIRGNTIRYVLPKATAERTLKAPRARITAPTWNSVRVPRRTLQRYRDDEVATTGRRSPTRASQGPRVNENAWFKGACVAAPSWAIARPVSRAAPARTGEQISPRIVRAG